MSNFDSCSWIVIDTETNGVSAPITVVELAAQRMRGWERFGAPFRRLLNQNADIPAEASRVNGYTREILARDGEPALDVYRDFAAYVDGLPIVSYNFEYDVDEVLRPELRRLGVEEIGSKGFCALRLVRRLLDPVQAGNCKLQTLRQFYRLPERGAHTALGDVESLIDLMKGVVQPLLQEQGLATWNDICAFAAEEWFPPRLAFGRYKGRDFRDATKDAELKSWLLWLSREPAGNSAMAKWYLARLDTAPVSFSSRSGPLVQKPEPPTAGTLLAGESAIAVVETATPSKQPLSQAIPPEQSSHSNQPAWQRAMAAFVVLSATVGLGYLILQNGAHQNSIVREVPAAIASIGMTTASQISVAIPEVAAQQKHATPPTSPAVSNADTLSGDFIPASQAQAYVGQHKLVCGYVARLKETSAGLFINLDKPYPNDAMSAIIWRKQLDRVGRLQLTENQRVCISGLIQVYNGKPQIEINNREQIAP